MSTAYVGAKAEPGFNPRRSSVPYLGAWLRSLPPAQQVDLMMLERETFLQKFPGYCPSCLRAHICMSYVVTRGTCILCLYKKNKPTNMQIFFGGANHGASN